MNIEILLYKMLLFNKAVWMLIFTNGIEINIVNNIYKNSWQCLCDHVYIPRSEFIAVINWFMWKLFNYNNMLNFAMQFWGLDSERNNKFIDFTLMYVFFL